MYSWEVIGTEAVISPVPWFWVGLEEICCVAWRKLPSLSEPVSSSVTYGE